MKLHISILIILVLCFSAFGQDSPFHRSIYVPLSKPPREQTATVYFYRVKEINPFDNSNRPVRLNGARFFRMKQERFIGFRLPAGRHELKMREKESELPLTLEAGKTYFVRVSEVVRSLGFDYKQSLKVVPKEQALAEMRGLQVIIDKDVLTKTLPAIKENPVGK